jgi:NAD kinase
MNNQKVVIVHRHTRLDELMVRHCTRGQVAFYLSRLGEDFAAYEDEHNRYYDGLNTLKSSLSRQYRLQMVERAHLPSYRFVADDIVIVIGQDGLVANTIKYLSTQAIIAVNPLPDLYDGKLLPFSLNECEDIVDMQANNKTLGEVGSDNNNGLKSKSISMAQITTNVGQTLLAVNDLFIGPKSHSSLRYHIQHGQQQECQSSSGIIVSTGLGATGWFSSILAGANGISGNSKQTNTALTNFQWDSPYLYFSVREPFPSQTTSTSIVFGKVNSRKSLTITSKTAENGVIFSDGIEDDAISFNAGTVAKVELSKRVGNLLIG